MLGSLFNVPPTGHFIWKRVHSLKHIGHCEVGDIEF